MIEFTVVIVGFVFVSLLGGWILAELSEMPREMRRGYSMLTLAVLAFAVTTLIMWLGAGLAEGAEAQGKATQTVLESNSSPARSYTMSGNVAVY